MACADLREAIRGLPPDAHLGAAIVEVDDEEQAASDADPTEEQFVDAERARAPMRMMMRRVMAWAPVGKHKRANGGLPLYAAAPVAQEPTLDPVSL